MKTYHWLRVEHCTSITLDVFLTFDLSNGGHCKGSVLREDLWKEKWGASLFKWSQSPLLFEKKVQVVKGCSTKHFSLTFKGHKLCLRRTCLLFLWIQTPTRPHCGFLMNVVHVYPYLYRIFIVAAFKKHIILLHHFVDHAPTRWQPLHSILTCLCKGSSNMALLEASPYN